ALILAINSQQLESRALGDVDAPLERITESLESRIDYSIGRLEARLSARLARVEGRSVAALFARVQRRYCTPSPLRTRSPSREHLVPPATALAQSAGGLCHGAAAVERRATRRTGRVRRRRHQQLLRCGGHAAGGV